MHDRGGRIPVVDITGAGPAATPRLVDSVLAAMRRWQRSGIRFL